MTINLTSDDKQQHCKYSIKLFLHISSQIFKTTEELDLGCGVGGGKDSRDVFKVGI